MDRHELPVCDYEGSSYQTDFWDRGGRSYEDQVEAIAISRLLPESGDRLLEVGAGAGRNTERYQGFDQIVLLDYSRSQLEQAQERLGSSDRYIYVAADVYRLPFNEAAFDAATMIRTLHHLADPALALGNIRKTLADGATFLLEFANKRNLKAILRWVARRQTWNPFDHETIEFAELNYDFHPAMVESWLNQTDYLIDKTLTVSHFRVQFLKRVVPLRLLVWADSVLQWTGDWWQITPSVFLQTHTPGKKQSVGRTAMWRCLNCSSLDLEIRKESLSCNSCAKEWPVRNGIFDFKST